MSVTPVWRSPCGVHVRTAATRRRSATRYLACFRATNALVSISHITDKQLSREQFKSCGFKILCCTALVYSSIFFCNVSVISSATYGTSLDLLYKLFLYLLATFLFISNTLEAISKHHSNEGHCKNITKGRPDMLYP